MVCFWWRRMFWYPKTLHKGNREFMNDKFKIFIDQIPGLASKLIDCSSAKWGDFQQLANGGGIYVLYENDLPVYVGRTRNFLRRLRQHGSKSSKHNSAPFAFNLAKEKYINKHGLIRVQLENIPEFRHEFEKAKERVRNMSFKFISVDDSIIQHLLEVYVSCELGTEKYNDFDTH